MELLGAPTHLVLAVFSHQLCLCLCVFFYLHHLLLTVILNSLNLPSQHAQSKDIFPHLCIVSELSGVHFL